MFSSKFQAHWHMLQQIGFAFVLILAIAVTAWAQTAPMPKKQKPKATKAAEAPAPEVVAPTPPPPPPTPEQMPPRPPTVSYQNGQLSIVAPNSTLSDILQAVKSKTGASIEIPPGANERVVSRFGPGPARDVLAALLNGSHFNYVMIGSDANPTSVAQIILTPRAGGETPPVNQANGAMPNPGMPQYPGQVAQPQPYPPGQPGYPQPPVVSQGEDAPAADSEQDDSAAQQDNANGTDEGAPEQVNQDADGQDSGQDNNGQPQVKTPEQLLQELQRQQQIQQQQQGQPGAPAPPVQPSAPPQ
jgi:hypothetical protein